uniref:Uncharacterized protein n=1 Tax=Arundo donax TaxID=35708 RepID=A0A0A9CJU3_ARUDO
MRATSGPSVQQIVADCRR